MWRLRHSFTRRKVKLHPTQRGETAMNGFAKVCRDGRLSDSRPQNLSRLLLHGAMVLGGAHTQTRFHLVIKIAGCNACHVSAPDIQQCADCNAIMLLPSYAKVNGTPSLDRSFLHPTIRRHVLPSARLPSRRQALSVGVEPNVSVPSLFRLVTFAIAKERAVP